MSYTKKYCPILGRMVKEKNDCDEKKKNISHDVAICQVEKNVCNGNCKGCSML